MSNPPDERWTAVVQVRNIRRKISARFNHDAAELVEHSTERQMRYGVWLIDESKPERQGECAGEDA